jgi:uncharacterized protein involved in exopolysaccharide biosynthesis
VTAQEPVAAKIIADTYVEQISAWNLQKRRNEISSTREFVEKQFGVFQEKLNAAEEGLRVFKEEHRMTALSNASAELVSRVAEAEAKYKETKTERAALEQRQSMIAQKKKELAPSLTVGSSPEIQQLKQQLAALSTICLAQAKASRRAAGMASMQQNQPGKES